MKNKNIIILLFLIISCIDVTADDNEIKIKTESAGFPHLVALVADVKVYDYPDIKTGKVIYTLALFEEVYASVRTIDSFRINDRIGRWVRITSPVIGWVFSEYLGQ